MSADEKIRVSGETPRATTPVLPTVNPGLEKSKPAGAGIHPTFYVMSVTFILELTFAMRLLLTVFAVLGSVSLHPSFCSTNGSSIPSTSVRSLLDIVTRFAAPLLTLATFRLPRHSHDLPLDLLDRCHPGYGTMDSLP
jgi:hypothetical protein